MNSGKSKHLIHVVHLVAAYCYLQILFSGRFFVVINRIFAIIIDWFVFVRLNKMKCKVDTGEFDPLVGHWQHTR